MQAFIPSMIRAGGGAIVNITSINEHRPLPLMAYAPTKVARGALTIIAAREFAKDGVRVNAVAPEFTLTPLFRSKIDAGTHDATDLKSHTAMGRWSRRKKSAAPWRY
jgi:NAD(P)-dependent dehydrogenase (short-subunit alcohol dehydrogenase family)